LSILLSRKASSSGTLVDLFDIDSFFDIVRRFADPEYIPSELDILSAHVLTTGSIQSTKSINDMLLSILEFGGRRAERRKWIRGFKGVNAVIFTVDIANYDLLLAEDNITNQREEDLTLFNSLVNSHWFIGTKFVLVFTKMDKLEKKLRKSPIENYVTDFEGDGKSVENVKAYMENSFLSLIKEKAKEDVVVLYTSFVEDYEVSGRMVLDALTKQLA
jgi:hypothetical protein